MAATTGSFTSEIAKEFVKGTVSAIGGEIGGAATDALFSALGLGGDSSTAEMTAQLGKLDQDLNKISQQLGEIEQELKELVTTAHYQLIETAHGNFITAHQRVLGHVEKIGALWDQADTATLADWNKAVLDVNNGAMAQIAALKQDLNDPASSAIDLFTHFLVTEITYVKPTAPWTSCIRYRTYVGYILYNMWRATLMAKAAHLWKGSYRPDLAKNCASDFLEDVRIIEDSAFKGMASIISALNTAYKDKGSMDRYYDMIFVVNDFDFMAFADGGNNFENAYSPRPYPAKAKANDLGRDFEQLEDLFATYRPIESTDRTNYGRISIYLSYWKTFYDKYVDSQQLDNIQLVNGIDAIDKNKTEINLHSDADDGHAYILHGNDLNKPLVFGDITAVLSRWVYFLPYGTYKVDEGERISAHISASSVGFMGSVSNYAVNGVGISEETPHKLIKWSPWDGLFQAHF